MTKNYEFPEELNEAQQKVVSLLSPPEQERYKYLAEHMSELREPQLSELRKLVDKIGRGLQGEDAIETVLKGRLEEEGWRVSLARGKQRGPDVQAHKGKRTIFMEVKGEPGYSAKSPVPSRRRKFLNDALGDILNRMRTQSGDVRYCIALPDTYLKLVKNRIPDWVREILGLYILFLKGGILKALRPTGEHVIDLGDFDKLFEK